MKADKSFGFYWVNDIVACVNNQWADYLDEVDALHSVDIVHVDARFLVNSHPLAEQGLADFLGRAAVKDIKVIIGLSWTDLAPIADNGVWATVLGRLHSICDNQDVYAFYFDEPLPSAQTLYLDRTASLRSEFPNSGVFAALQPGDLDAGYAPEMFANTTDIGLDYYPGLYFSDPYPESFATYWSKVERLAVAGQKLWIVPPLYIPAGITDHITYRWMLYNAFSYFYAFAMSHPAIAGIIAFLYSPFSGVFDASLRQLLVEPSIKTLIKGVK